MRRAWMLVAIVLAALASGARAQGVNLSWHGATAASACPTNAGAYVDWADPCDGSDVAVMVGSVVAPTGLTKVIGQEVHVEMEAAGPASLPDFWHFEAGGCGQGKLLVEALFTGFATGTATTQCSDYWGTAATGSFTWTSSYDGWFDGHLFGAWTRPADTAGPMTAGRQYYVFRATFQTDHASSCAGCEVPGCWLFCGMKLIQPYGLGDAIVTQTATRSLVTWFGGAGTLNCPPLHWTGCYSAVPARRSTWGQVKSLYR